MSITITRALLDNLFVGFSAKFNGAFLGYKPRWQQIAMLAPSSARENHYGWLKGLKKMREWLGDRQAAALETDGYRIINKAYENTVDVSRFDLEDDQVGIYSPMFEDLGQTAAELPDQLVFALLKAGFATNCYDGQFFFDTDHPVIGSDGNPTTWSNSGGGAGEGWYLLCTKRPVKPLIYQERQKAKLTRMDREEDEQVFNQAKFRYGVDTRGNVGYGLPQLAYGSKQALNAANYGAARASIMSRTGDFGRPLGLVPDTLVVSPANEAAARALLVAQKDAAGADNVWFGTAELIVEPLLA